MAVVAFVLLLVAVEFVRSNWQSLSALALCLLTVGLIVEFASKTSADITF